MRCCVVRSASLRTLLDLIDQGRPPIVCIDIDLESFQPSDKLRGQHTHFAVIEGYFSSAAADAVEPGPGPEPEPEPEPEFLLVKQSGSRAPVPTVWSTTTFLASWRGDGWGGKQHPSPWSLLLCMSCAGCAGCRMLSSDAGGALPIGRYRNTLHPSLCYCVCVTLCDTVCGCAVVRRWRRFAHQVGTASARSRGRWPTASPSAAPTPRPSHQRRTPLVYGTTPTAPRWGMQRRSGSGLRVWRRGCSRWRGRRRLRRRERVPVAVAAGLRACGWGRSGCCTIRRSWRSASSRSGLSRDAEQRCRAEQQHQ